MTRTIRNIVALLLTVVFMWHFSSVSMFPHTHIVDGVVICHSHPFSGSADNPGHSHTGTQLETIAYLSLFIFLITGISVMLDIIPVSVFRRFTDRCLHVQAGTHAIHHLRGPPSDLTLS